MSSIFAFTSTISTITLFSNDPLSYPGKEFDVKIYRMRDDSGSAYDTQYFTVQFDSAERLTFTFPYEYDPIYTEYYIETVNTETSVIPSRDNKYKLGVNDFDEDTVLSLIDANIYRLEKFNFYKCVNLRRVKTTTISNNISYAFYNCKNLTSVELGVQDNVNTFSDLNLSFLFYKCEKLEKFSYKYLGMNTSHFWADKIENGIYAVKTVNLNYAFFDCKSIREMSIYEHDIFPIEHIELRSTFDGCSSIESITLPSYFSNNPVIYNCANMCYRCHNLVTIMGLEDMRIDLTNSNDVGHIFDTCLNLESAPNLLIKPSTELRKVRTTGIFNNCRKLNKVSITSDNEDYYSILSSPNLDQEEDVMEERETLVVSFSEPNRAYSMKNAFNNQRRTLFLYDFRGTNISDTEFMFNECKDVFVNRKYWELEVGYGKYGLSNEYQVKYAEGGFTPSIGGTSINTDPTKYPLPINNWDATIVGINANHENFLPLQVKDGYYRKFYTNYVPEYGFYHETPSAVVEKNDGGINIFPVFTTDEDVVEDVTFIVNMQDSYDITDDYSLYINYCNQEQYNPKIRSRGLITNSGSMADEIILDSSNIELCIIPESFSDGYVAPFVKLNGIDFNKIHGWLNTEKLELVYIDSNVEITGTSELEESYHVLTKKIDYRSDTYIGKGLYMIFEARIYKPDNTYVSKYFKLFRPSTTNGEGFTFDSTILTQSDSLDELLDAEHYYVEYSISARNTTDTLCAYTETETDKYYSYMPRLYINDEYSNTNYERIEIFTNDNILTDNINILATDVKRVRIWYSPDITAIKFIGSNSSHCMVTAIEDINIDNLNDMSYMFANCSHLSVLDTSNWVKDNVEVRHMFENCSSLTSIDLSGFTTNELSDISYTFSGCNSLAYLDISSWDTSNIDVTGVSHLFTNVPESVNWDYDGLNYINFEHNEIETDFRGAFPWNMHPDFYMQYKIVARNDTDRINASISTGQHLYLPQIYRIYNLDTGSTDYTYYGYCKIEIVRKDGTVTVDVNTLANEVDTIKIWYLPQTTAIKFYGSNTLYPMIMTLEYMNVQNIIDFTHMFSNCSYLQEVQGIETWITAEQEDLRYMFYNCSSLLSLDLDLWDVSNVKNMDYMFSNCTSLQYLNLVTWNTLNATGSLMFHNVSINMNEQWNYDPYGSDSQYQYFNLTESETGYSLRFPWNKYCVEYTLYYSSNTRYDIMSENLSAYIPQTNVSFRRIEVVLKDGTIVNNFDVAEGNVNTIKLYYNGRAQYMKFRGTESNPHRISRLTYILSTGFTDMSYMFYNSRISYIKDLSCNLVSNMSYMFYNCVQLSSLTSLSQISSRTTNTSYMFYGCTNLKTLNLSGWNTSYITNCQSMFTGLRTDINWEYEDYPSANYTRFKLTERQTGFSGIFPWNNSTSDDGVFGRYYLEYTPFKGFGKSTMATLKLNDPEYLYIPTASHQQFRSIEVTMVDGTVTSRTDVLVKDVSKIRIVYYMHTTYIKFFTKLESVYCCVEELNYIDTTNFTDTSHMFEGGLFIKKLNLANSNTKNVKSYDSMFNHVPSSAVITIDEDIWNPNMTEAATGFTGIFRRS